MTALAVTVVASLVIVSGLGAAEAAAEPVGTIANFAGHAIPTSGNAGDGGPATAALMDRPGAIAVDQGDNIYIADSLNNRIRKVDTGGTVTAFAGYADGHSSDNGDGIAATITGLDDPSGLAVDAGGNVYIADTLHNRVRKVNAAGIITNVAGLTNDFSGNSGDGGPATAASLTYPMAVAVDHAGNVYVADSFDNRVRVVDHNGIISNFAGSATRASGNSGDGGPAGSATLSNPDGLAVDAVGNVYIADSGNNRVRKVDTSGTISNFAGYGPGGPDGIGNAGDGGPAVSATLTLPTGLAVDSAGDVYISDPTNDRVRQVVGAHRVAPAFTADHPPTSGSISATYRYTFAATGSPAPVFSVASGNLPPGLALDRVSGVLSGALPVTANLNTFTVQASNGTVSPPAVSQPITINTAFGNQSPYVFSPSSATFTVGTAGSFTVTTTGYPAPTVTEQGPLPAGVLMVGNGDGTATFTGTPTTGQGGVYHVMLTATNGIAPAGTQSFTLTVIEPPIVVVPQTKTFTVGVVGSVTLTATGYPAPNLTETGALPPGVTFDATKAVLSGAPAQGTSGTYPLYFHATNGVSGPATQQLTLTVDQALFTNPTNGATDVYATQPFTWTTIPEAQAYRLILGTTPYGADLLVTGILAPSTTSYAMPAMPAGPTLYATLFAEVNGGWTSYQEISFTAYPNFATFTFPVDKQTNVDPTRAFTWTPTPLAGGYILVVGTSPFAHDLVNSGILDLNAHSYAVPNLPAGQKLYATLLTNFNGRWDRFQAITFTEGPLARGNLTYPVNDQLNVATPGTFTWSTIPEAEAYDLVIGTAAFGTDLVSSGVLPPAQSSLGVPALPSGRLLYATLLTEVDGTWRYEAIDFTASGSTRTNPASRHAPAGV